MIGAIFTVVTLYYNHKGSESAEKQEQYRRASDMRSTAWGEVAPTLNDMYAYFLFVGSFKNISPETIIKDKRAVDSIMWTNRTLYDEDTFKAYLDFMDAAFRTYNGWQIDPSLRTVEIRRLDNDIPKEGFTGEDNRDCINKTYWLLQNKIAATLDIQYSSTPHLTQPEISSTLLGKSPISPCPVK